MQRMRNGAEVEKVCTINSISVSYGDEEVRFGVEK